MLLKYLWRYCFNPRSPRGGATTFALYPCRFYKLFQSTLPTRGSDGAFHSVHNKNYWFQSTLPTRGSDQSSSKYASQNCMFQSTLPTRGSDLPLVTIPCNALDVSIHAPHEGERPYGLWATPHGTGFQSTLPTRGSDGGKVHLYAAFPRIY